MAKLIGFVEPSRMPKEMFGLSLLHTNNGERKIIRLEIYQKIHPARDLPNLSPVYA